MKTVSAIFKVFGVTRPGFEPGVSSRGAQPPYNFLHWPCFLKFINIASKVFSTAMINYALLRGY